MRAERWYSPVSYFQSTHLSHGPCNVNICRISVLDTSHRRKGHLIAVSTLMPEKGIRPLMVKREIQAIQYMKGHLPWRGSKGNFIIQLDGLLLVQRKALLCLKGTLMDTCCYKGNFIIQLDGLLLVQRKALLRLKGTLMDTCCYKGKIYCA
jgi:hypothetical protein